MWNLVTRPSNMMTGTLIVFTNYNSFNFFLSPNKYKLIAVHTVQSDVLESLVLPVKDGGMRFQL